MSCPSGKKEHQKKKEALKSARKVNRVRYAGMNWCRVYLCDLCHHWHLTSKPLRKKVSL